MNCEFCDKPVPPERLEANPSATACVKCLLKNGDVPMKKGRMRFDCKTNGEIDIMDEKTLEEINHLDPRGYKKSTLAKDDED